MRWKVENNFNYIIVHKKSWPPNTFESDIYDKYVWYIVVYSGAEFVDHCILSKTKKVNSL